METPFQDLFRKASDFNLMCLRSSLSPLHESPHPQSPSSMSLSPRGEAAIRPSSAYQQALIHLPQSTINLATAENMLSLPSITNLLNKVAPITPSELTYTAMHGSPETIAALSKFLSTHLDATISTDSITITSGVSASLDALAHALAEEGDRALTSSPCYRGLSFLLSARSGVRLITAAMDSCFPPVLTVELINRAWEDAGGTDSRIRFLLLVNPDNPTGVIHSPQLVLQLVNWARERDLHIVVDECYALSTHNSNFKSVLTLVDPRDDVHVVWGVSKDLSLPGIRLGAIITHNERLQKALHTNLAYFSTSSRLAQYAIRGILPQLDAVIAENQGKLKRGYEFCRTRLQSMGAEVVNAGAGFFVWANFGKWVRDKRDEERLWNMFCGRGVLILPGAEAYASRPGCFRICYAGVEREMLEKGLERIESVLREVEEERDGG